MAAPPPMGGFVTPMTPQMASNMNMAGKHGNEGPAEDEPSNKKLRNEDSLIPEAVFLARNAVSYAICIKLHCYLKFYFFNRAQLILKLLFRWLLRNRNGSLTVKH